MVNSSPTENAWRIHLNGLLALMNHYDRTGAFSHSAVSSHLLTGSNSSTFCRDRSSETQSGMENPRRLFDQLQLRLYRLAPQLDSTFGNSANPRKLDVQKIRVEVKKIYNDCLLVRQVLPREMFSNPDILTMRIVNTLNMILILSGTFLFECGAYLAPEIISTASKECQRLSKSIRDAVNSIYASVSHWFHYDTADQRPFSAVIGHSIRTLDTLFVMWPLYVASKAHLITPTQRTRIRNILHHVGEAGHVPKAVALVRPLLQIAVSRHELICDQAEEAEQEPLNYTEAMAGCCIINLGFVVTQVHQDWNM